MKLLFVNYENAGVPEIFEDTNLVKLSECADSIDQGIGDIFKFENGSWHQAVAEKKYEEPEEEEDTEEGGLEIEGEDESLSYTWEVTFKVVG